MKIAVRNFLALALIVTFPILGVAQSRSKSATQSFDVIIKGGTVYDGTGGMPRRADVGIAKDRIAVIGNLSRATAKPGRALWGPGKI